MKKKYHERSVRLDLCMAKKKIAKKGLHFFICSFFVKTYRTHLVLNLQKFYNASIRNVKKKRSENIGCIDIYKIYETFSE